MSAPALPEAWESALHRQHPLVGRIYDVRAGRYVDRAALEAAAASAHFLFLGETHDNPDHHRLQAWLVRVAARSGRRPALAFEMLDEGQQGAVDAALAAPDRSPDALARAVSWDRSGWPRFAMYRPIFAAGLELGMPIVAANLPRGVVRAVVERGRQALPEPLQRALARDEPLSPALQESLRSEMAASHCGLLPPALLDPMALAQRARDAEMARRMVEADRGGGAILVTGAGHARTDRGVPAQVARDAPGRSSVSVALVEVSPERCAPGAYAEEYSTAAPPFDYLVFTPAAERDDPCRALHHMSR